MGGQAFAQSGPNGTPLNVPRMPRDVYQKLAADVQAKLLLIFRNVKIPRDAPGKLDFGDIDFLVEGTTNPWTPDSIGYALGAAHRISNGNSHSFAVPYVDVQNQFVQVDVEISPGNGTPDSAELFEWEYFMKSDSDLMQIVGVSHRSFGLTCNDKGLHVRVSEIEPYNKKKALLFLTRDPQQALEFYGFDFAKYTSGFGSDTDLFDWISGGRFFTLNNFREREEKANDRARQRKRPMYSKFIEEYIPSKAEAATLDTTWTRQKVLEEALDVFQKRDVYESMIREHQLRERDKELWRHIRESLPLQGNALGIALKGLKRWVKFENGEPSIAAVPLIAEQPVWALEIHDEEEVITWVGQNWQKAKTLEKARATTEKQIGRAQYVQIDKLAELEICSPSDRFIGSTVLDAKIPDSTRVIANGD